MKEISLEERLSELEGTVRLLKSEMEDILIKTYNKAVEDNDIDLASEVLRKIRNKELEESDKEFNIDRLELNFKNITDFLNSLKDSTNNEWSLYRQKLRDLPEQSGFPLNIEFPQRPLNNNCKYITLDKKTKKMLLKSDSEDTLAP